jgi:hypothetical protein
MRSGMRTGWARDLGALHRAQARLAHSVRGVNIAPLGHTPLPSQGNDSLHTNHSGDPQADPASRLQGFKARIICATV